MKKLNLIVYLLNIITINNFNEIYEKIIKDFPKTSCATSSKTKLAEINNSTAGKNSSADNANSSGN